MRSAKAIKTAYAQWEDAGPFRTDHWQYVFGNERPKPNLNKGAGLDVSPAVRDYLGMQDTDVTDWKFVEFKEVPRGPWAQLRRQQHFRDQSAEQHHFRRAAALEIETSHASASARGFGCKPLPRAQKSCG